MEPVEIAPHMFLSATLLDSDTFLDLLQSVKRHSIDIVHRLYLMRCQALYAAELVISRH